MAQIPKRDYLPGVSIPRPLSGKPGLMLTTFGLRYLKPRLYNFDTPDADFPLDKKSLLGTPVFSSIIVEPGSFLKAGEETPTKYRGIELVTVLMEVSQSKNIVTTVIQGRNGSVKEYISDGDYDITIRGALVSRESNLYPASEVENLIEILKAPASLEVASRFLQFFSIHNMVITGYSFPQTEGFNNMQSFEIRAVSDEPIELSPVK